MTTDQVEIINDKIGAVLGRLICQQMVVNACNSDPYGHVSESIKDLQKFLAWCYAERDRTEK